MKRPNMLSGFWLVGGLNATFLYKTPPETSRYQILPSLTRVERSF